MISDFDKQLILKKKNLIDITKNLTRVEYIEIFNIIKSNGCNFTENKNGIFINLNNIKEDIIEQIFKCIEFINNSKEELTKHEEYVNTMKKNMEESINTNLSKNIIVKTDFERNDNNLNDLESFNDDKKNEICLNFSSDEDEDIDNTINLKKKKVIKVNKFIKEKKN